ncbi:ROK family protein [Arthrobacter sp. M4]|uniref:ROK family protein n=1 Tax=Arthrobacter sp. M4 TaxID=218160 RepID=UPI001CDB683F|nr:ROK family protein [Arthrobacter sp. M4]MCA4132901.1 ROK family protein [Arthrobacter sp. M4]
MLDVTGATPQLARRINASAVLGVMRNSSVVTVSELIEATGLTRATAISVCEELLGRGWIRELDTLRTAGGYQKGRPARRFELEERAGFVLGIDVGAAKTTVVVADLRGDTVGKASLPFTSFDITSDERVGTIKLAVQQALDDADTDASHVLAGTAGIAAPVDREGNILASQQFWAQFDVGLKSAFQEQHGWTVQLENDANLAALGERWRGAAAGVDDLVVILSSERFGSGVMESGRLLHGTGGGAGEMAYLNIVEGVGSTHGIAFLARNWAEEALKGKAKSLLRKKPDGGTSVEAEDVFAAARQGDKVAQSILARLADRVARIVGTASTLINPELVVLGGAVSGSVSAIVPTITALLPEYTATPPRLAASTLGDRIVTVGAVRHALDYVEANSLDLELAGASS